MRKRSRQLIADLVAGRSENPTEAMETIARSPRMLAAYEEQVAARDALSRLGPIALTEAERTDLRREVWTNLTAAPSTRPTAAPTWGWRAAGAAAALAVVVGGAALLMQAGSEAGEQAADLRSDNVTTTAGAGQPLAGQDHGGEVDGALPESVETEEVLRRYAEIVRNDTELSYAVSEADVRCADIEDLEGQRPVASFEIEGIEYQAWIPAEIPPDQVDAATPITFVDVATCSVQPVTR